MADYAALIARETERFIAAHPKCAARAGDLAAHWLSGAPMHWMRDWASPFPIVVEDAEGATLTDIDDNVYDDFCLGDTPGMFGHGLAPVARVAAEQLRRGATYMLPTEEAAEVGALLAQRFGLPYWQATLSASDANRALIRWARAVTGKRVILVFDGCYHGMVEDCFVALDGDRTIMDPGLVGQVQDYTQTTRVIPFNDIAALEAALAQGDVAAVLAEPAMTNAGMILPIAGFHAKLRELTRKAGAMLILDETHTLSTGPGGAARAWGLAPDALVIGKAIAGGVPAAVWGVSAGLGERISSRTAGELPRPFQNQAPRSGGGGAPADGDEGTSRGSAFNSESAPPQSRSARQLLHRGGAGRSGVGTTLAGNAFSIAAIGAVLREVATEEAYATMLAGTDELVAGLNALIAKRHLPWCVVHVGARAEIVFAPEPPRNTKDMAPALAQRALNHALHLYLINRGVLIAPFHMMMLVSPATSSQQIARLIEAIDAFAQESSE